MKVPVRTKHRPPVRLNEASRRHGWLVAVTLAGAIALAYGNALQAGLIFDSEVIIRQDPRIQTLNLENLRAMFLDDYWHGLKSNLYRPLTTFSYAINYAIMGSGDKATGYVAVNLLCHFINALLVVTLGRQWGLSRGAALAGGCIFAVHPLHSEAITNVVGRADLLAAMGVMSGLCLHGWQTRRNRRGWWRWAGLMAAGGLAIGSKESGIVLIGLLVLHDLSFAFLVQGQTISEGRTFFIRQMIHSYVWCLVPVCAWFVLRQTAIADAVMGPYRADNPLLMLNAVEARLGATGILWRYVGLFFWPVHLSSDYSYNAIPLFDESWHLAHMWMHLAGAGLLVVAGVLAWRIRHQVPIIPLGAGFFVIAMAPVSNLFIQIGTILAERLMYLPSVGLILPLSWAGGAFMEWAGRRWPKGRVRGVAIPVLLAILTALAGRTILRNQNWRTGVALFESALKVCPDSFKVNRVLADELYIPVKDNDELLRARIDRILALTEKGRRILRQLPPEAVSASLLSNLATFYMRKSELVPESEKGLWLDRAEQVCREAIELEKAEGVNPSWRLRQKLAELLITNGRDEKAVEAYAEALLLAPGPEILEPLALLLDRLNRPDEALRLALRLITIRPDHSAMWKIISRYYENRHPGELTVAEVDGRWLFNIEHPAVLSDLWQAAHEQYTAATRLQQTLALRSYREAVQATLGIDPAQPPPSPVTK